MKLKFRWSKAGMMAQAPSSSLLCYSYRSTSCHDPRWWPGCLLLLPELTPDPHSKPVSLVQSLSCVRLFVTPWTEACQASLSITNFQSLLKLMSIELVMPSNHLILCSPLLLPPSVFPSIRVFSGGQSIGVSASASVLPISIQDWFPLRWTVWISLQSKGLSRVFSNTTVQKHQLFSAQLSL